MLVRKTLSISSVGMSVVLLWPSARRRCSPGCRGGGTVEGPVNDPPAAAGLADVAANGHCLVPRLLHHPHRLLRIALLVEVRDEDVSALACEAEHRSPDTTIASSDHCRFAFQPPRPLHDCSPESGLGSICDRIPGGSCFGKGGLGSFSWGFIDSWFTVSSSLVACRRFLPRCRRPTVAEVLRIRPKLRRRRSRVRPPRHRTGGSCQAAYHCGAPKPVVSS